MFYFRYSKAWSLGILTLAMTMLVFGCGSSNSQTSSSSSGPAGKSPGPADKPEILHSNERIKGQNFCKSAVVSIGSKPGEIRFVAHCSGRKSDGVAFTLVGYSVKDGSRLGINSYTQTPSVGGAGAVSRRGECSMKQNIIACNAKINGPVVISGRFQVNPESRCSAEISLVGVVSPPCRGEYCSGAPRFDELFSNKPRGCSGPSN